MAGKPNEPSFEDEERATIAAADAQEPAEADDNDAALANAEPDTGETTPATGADGKTAPKNQMVPHGAMEKERQRRKGVETELQRERQTNAERQARLEERLEIINGLFQPAPAAPPNPDQDIFGYVEHLNGQVRTLQQERQQEQARQQQAAQQNQQISRLTSAYREDAARFSQETPDFKDAYQFMLNSRGAELKAAGYDDATIQQTLRNDELAIANFAFQNQRSPAETVYQMAQARGYRQAPTGGLGAIVADARAQPNGGNAQLQQLQRAQAASVSLGRAGGSAGGMKLSLEAIDRMPQSEFEALVRAKNAKDPNGFDDFIRKLELGNAA